MSWKEMKIYEEDKKEIGIKFDKDKLRFDLIPVKPLEELARVYTIGAKKYSDRNWEKGIDWGRLYGAMLRHATAWWKGEAIDLDDRQHHLASVAWCAFALIEYEKTHPEFDPRQNYSAFAANKKTSSCNE